MDVARLLSEQIQAKSLPGEEAPARAVLKAALEGLGLDVEVDALGNLEALLEGPGPELLFTGHMDVVPAGDEAAWPVPPFSGAVKDGFVWGRGAVDMKGALAAMVAAVARLVEAGTPRRVRLLFVVAEEIGGAGSRYAAGRLRPAAIVLGEPSGLRLMRGHRGRIEPHLIFPGRQGHAALPNDDNPLFKLGRALRALEDLDLGTDPETGKNTLQPTQVFVRPNAINVVPGEVELTLDGRYGPGVEAKALLKKLAALGEVVLPELGLGEVRYPADFPPYVLPEDHPLLKQALSLLGQEAAGLWPFTTDAPYLAKTGAPILGLGPGDPALAHTLEERLAVEELEAAVAAYHRLAVGLGRG